MVNILPEPRSGIPFAGKRLQRYVKNAIFLSIGINPDVIIGQHLRCLAVTLRIIIQDCIYGEIDNHNCSVVKYL
jgi:hypothetical protein